MPFRQIVVDRKVLDSLKRRFLNHYPREYGEYGVGKAKHGLGWDTAHIHYFRDVEILKQHQDFVQYVDDNEDCEPEDSKRTVLLFIHSHPDTTCDPSDGDWKNLRDGEEPIMGVCGIRKTRSGRRFVSWGFWDKDGEQLELVIAE